MAAGLSSAIGSVPMAKVDETASVSYSIPEPIENGSMLAPKLDSREAAPIHNGKIDSEDSGEIVQIPLDDSDVRDLESQPIDSEQNAVPLSDAPLIGAPFRLMSFVAKYVSGADLVNNTT